MIKAIILDLDGTLLTSEKQISPRTGNFLLECMKRGIKIIIATARPPRLKQMLSIDHSFEPIIQGDGVFYNGGCTKIAGKKNYVPITMNSQLQDFLLAALNHTEYRCNCAMQLKNEIHALYKPLTDDELKIWGLNRKDLQDFSLSFDQEIIKIILYLTDPEKTEFFQDAADFSETSLTAFSNTAKAFILFPQVNVLLTDQGRVIQIMNASINKLTGLKKILNTFNIPSDHVAVFGDDLQDIDMLSHFKHSFAMGNASEKVKKYAAFTTLSNDNDGIFHALHNNLIQLN
ncbi:MAG: HAD family hydrolase [Spirochaetales bacterium]|nr:HAD family hydrolase [Spirochaetales bacterium]